MEDDLKTCTGCGEPKPLSGYFMDKRRGKPRAQCKACYSVRIKKHYAENKEYYADFTRRWRENNQEKTKEISNRSRAKRRLAIHGAWLAFQGGVCPICKTPQDDPLSMHLDHCHRTGVVRGLLCKSCNYLLGHCDDDPVVLTSAIQYLEAHAADLTAPKVHKKSAWWRSMPPT